MGSFTRMRRILAAVLVLTTACTSSETTDSLPNLGPFDFVGQVANVEFGDGWTMDPPGVALATGAPDSDVTVGPQTMTLSDGTRLQVNAGTPGGNRCLALLHPSMIGPVTGDPEAVIHDVPRLASNVDWRSPCVIAGQVNADGAVAWFTILPVTEHEGEQYAELGVTTRSPVDGVITTSVGYKGHTDTTVTDCGRPIGSVPGARVLLDWATGDVVLACQFDG